MHSRTELIYIHADEKISFLKSLEESKWVFALICCSDIYNYKFSQCPARKLPWVAEMNLSQAPK